MASGRYFLWILVMIALMLPLVSIMPRPAIQLNVPIELYQPVPNALSESTAPAAPIAQFPDTTLPVHSYMPGATADSATLNVVSEAPAPAQAVLLQIRMSRLILVIWLSGITLSLAFHAYKHLLFKRFVRRWSVLETDKRITAILDDEASRLGIRKPIRLKRCKSINAPMLTGIWETRW